MLAKKIHLHFACGVIFGDPGCFVRGVLFVCLFVWCVHYGWDFNYAERNMHHSKGSLSWRHGSDPHVMCLYAVQGQAGDDRVDKAYVSSPKRHQPIAHSFLPTYLCLCHQLLTLILPVRYFLSASYASVIIVFHRPRF
jgi:hypothetical protein